MEGFLTNKKKVMFAFTLIITLGFLATSFFSYSVSKNLLQKQITQKDLPLTSDNIYSEIQRDLLRPIFISSLMANDTFLRDWVLSGESDTNQISRYLKEIKEEYNTFSSFFISEKTRNYYHPQGILKQVKEEEPRDVWYFRIRQMENAYETNVDVDLANKDTLTIFINYKVFDYTDNFIGVVGVGLAINHVKDLIQSYQQRYHRRIYLVNPQGEITVKSPGSNFPEKSVFEIPDSEVILKEILTNQDLSSRHQYQLNRSMVYLHSRYIPEFNWYLFVEETEGEAIATIKNTFLFNIGICLTIAVLVLFLTNWLVSGYQRRLELMATTDKLTGVYNRQAFDMFFHQHLKEQNRRYLPFTLLSIDIDHFKLVNDTHGHPVGDLVLQGVAEKIQAIIRREDIFCRWGGEEFLLLLKKCNLEQGCRVADSICQAVREHRSYQGKKSIGVTVSIGVTLHERGEEEKALFDRVDKALYLAKEKGRDRYETATSS
ncbi:MAG: sensor domain-containing diguanylate cyclase [Proteobacteria bacterium]|nr:sensor domain-containing diguanylate cyclase [Pseudomonadota bacterium]